MSIWVEIWEPRSLATQVQATTEPSSETPECQVTSGVYSFLMTGPLKEVLDTACPSYSFIPVLDGISHVLGRISVYFASRLKGTVLQLLCAMMIACRHDGFVGSIARKRICKAQTVKNLAAARMAYHNHGFYLYSIRGWTSSETSLSVEARSSGSVRVARLSYALQG